MAETKAVAANAEKHRQAVDRMAAARAARGSGQSPNVNLDDRQKFALATMQRARSNLKTAQDGLKAGWGTPAELIDACSRINAAVGKMLFD